MSEAHPGDVLRAHAVAASDNRRTVLPATSLLLRPGDLLVARGDPGHAHTVLALALAGRFEPLTGTVTLADDPDRVGLQRAVALVDVPEVSEPDPNVPLTTIVGEELAMARRPASPAAVRRWLEQQGFEALIGLRIEELPARARVAILATLAAERPGVRHLVLTLPERHGDLTEAWLGVAEDLAATGLGVLVTVSLGAAERLAETRPDLAITTLGESGPGPNRDPDHPEAS